MYKLNTVCFIGLGLIGGSMAKSIKQNNKDITIMAYSRTKSKLQMAQNEGIIDIILDDIDSSLSACDLIILCSPVSYNIDYLKQIKPFLKSDCIVTDVGSTKLGIHKAAFALDMEEHFIGGHPMAGSERTGYENSNTHLLENSYYIITPSSKSNNENISFMTDLALSMGAIPLVLGYNEHDRVVAAISHLPHIIASGLVNIVKQSDSENETMKLVAAGGFKDITRIASASPIMWQQICATNAENIVNILDIYIDYLKTISGQLSSGDFDAIHSFFENSKNYRDSIDDGSLGPIKKEYSIYMDIADKSGSISTVAVILAAKGISIKNIGIIHNREFEEGVLKIIFYDNEAFEHAVKVLEGHNYSLYKR
jgi:Prephenate dehydrogenase